MTSRVLRSIVRHAPKRVRGGEHPLDFFATLPFEVELLLDAVPAIGGKILDPCCGSGTEIKALWRRGVEAWGNDLNPRFRARWHMDASGRAFWEKVPRPDWVVCNPPFDLAGEIVPLALEHARLGVAFYLRLLWLQTRRPLFQTHRLSHLIVLPQSSYTGDGKKDPVTRAWFVWPRDYRGHTRIIFPDRPHRK